MNFFIFKKVTVYTCFQVTFVKMYIWEVASWEIVTWEVALGKMLL